MMVSKKTLQKEIENLKHRIDCAEKDRERLCAQLSCFMKEFGYLIVPTMGPERYQLIATEKNMFAVIFDHFGLKLDDSLRLIEKGEKE